MPPRPTVSGSASGTNGVGGCASSRGGSGSGRLVCRPLPACAAHERRLSRWLAGRAVGPGRPQPALRQSLCRLQFLSSCVERQCAARRVALCACVRPLALAYLLLARIAKGVRPSYVPFQICVGVSADGCGDLTTARPSVPTANINEASLVYSGTGTGGEGRVRRGGAWSGGRAAAGKCPPMNVPPWLNGLWLNGLWVGGGLAAGNVPVPPAST